MKSAPLAMLAGAAVMVWVALEFGTAPVLRGWLAAAVGLTALPLGALLLLLTDHLIPDGWSLKLDRTLEAAALTMPVAALAFFPLLAFPDRIWPWAATAPWPEDWPNPQWLQPGFFALRTLLYFTAWIALALLGATRSRKRRRPAVASAGLIVLTLAATGAFFDWTMSLEPAFHSTIYGMMLLSQQVLGGFCVAVLAALLSRDAGELKLGPLSGVLLSLLLLWAYLSFCQYLIVWSGDLPAEIAWYLRRVVGGWEAVPWIVGLGSAAAFLLLLPARLRHSRRALGLIAGFLLALRIVETAWLVLPAWGPSAAALAAYGGALAMGGGMWVMAFLWLRKRRPVQVAHV